MITEPRFTVRQAAQACIENVRTACAELSDMIAAANLMGAQPVLLHELRLLQEKFAGR